MLPQLDGVGLIRAMRADGVATPVLFLTNLSGIDDRVEGGMSRSLLKIAKRSLRFRTYAASAI
jgi:DNA-binding response OmpR family regulator